MSKQYVILNYENLEVTKLRDDPSEAEAYWGAWMAYVKAINEAGVVRGGEGLDYPSTATTVTFKNGKQVVQDGPFADTKEQLAGFSSLRFRISMSHWNGLLGTRPQRMARWRSGRCFPNLLTTE